MLLSHNSPHFNTTFKLPPSHLFAFAKIAMRHITRFNFADEEGQKDYYELTQKLCIILKVIMTNLSLIIPIFPFWESVWNIQANKFVKNLDFNNQDQFEKALKLTVIYLSECPGMVINERLCILNPVYEKIEQIAMIVFEKYPKEFEFANAMFTSNPRAFASAKLYNSIEFQTILKT
jgi:hypothetical protein